MRRLHGLLTTAFLAPFMLLPPPLSAQTALDGIQQSEGAVWVQIEALPTLSRAQDRVRAYGARLGDVAGFDLGNGWYGVVLGPYAPADAEAVLRRLRALGDIPSDSYITTGATFARQYWPIGAGNNVPRPIPETIGTLPDPEPPVVTGDAMLDALAADLAAAIAEAATGQTTDTLPPPDALPAPDALIETEADIALPEITPSGDPLPADPLPEVTFPNAPVIEETEREALASEALLTRSQKEQLQEALQWAGFYTGAIDGAYGRGTRSAMSAWQTAQGKPATGVLTTRERASLLDAYNAVLTDTGLALVSDPEAGIEVIMPTDAVAHSDTTPPFVVYGATGVVPEAQVILLSQPGDQRRLAGLYEIIQSLDHVPPAATRSLTANGFTILGGNEKIQSYTHAVLTGGEIKGFTLVWPTEDERFTRLWQEMRNSFTPIAGVLPAVEVPATDLATLDLASGLALRQPRAVGAGVFVNASGAVLTDAGLVEQCDRIAIAGDYDARVTHRDGALAVLTPDTRIAPPATARFADRAAAGRLAVAGYPYGAALLAPTLTFGTAAGAGGLSGEAGVTRLSITGAAGDRGGPVLDASGAVVGIYTQPAVPSGQILPADAGFMQDAATVMASLSSAGVGFERSTDSAEIAAPTLTRRAGEMVVQVACW